MTVKHHAYIFDLPKVMDSMRDAIGYSPIPDYDSFFDRAIKSVDYDNYSMKDFLDTICFYDEKLDRSNPGSSMYWFLVILGSHLKMAPNLSSSIPFSYDVFYGVLPVMGWSKSEIQYLLTGNSIKSLLETCAPSSYQTIIDYQYSDYGWLEKGEIEHLYQKLVDLHDIFLEPPQHVRVETRNYAHSNTFEPEEMIRRAYFDARKMLEYAIHNNSSILLILNC